MSKDLSAGFRVIAKAAKAEKIADSSGDHFVPSNNFQVAGCDSEQLTLTLEFVEELADRRACVSTNFTGVFGNLLADDRSCGRQSLLKSSPGNSAAVKRHAQNSHISLSMIGNALNRGIDSIDLEHCLMQSVPMHQVACDEDCPIDVKQVGIS